MRLRGRWHSHCLGSSPAWASSARWLPGASSCADHAAETRIPVHRRELRHDASSFSRNGQYCLTTRGAIKLQRIVLVIGFLDDRSDTVCVIFDDRAVMADRVQLDTDDDLRAWTQLNVTSIEVVADQERTPVLSTMVIVVAVHVASLRTSDFILIVCLQTEESTGPCGD